MANIEITKEEYRDLLQEHFEYNLLLNTIFNNVEMSNWRNELRINGDDVILSLLNGMHPTRFDAVTRYCREERDKKLQSNIDESIEEEEECSED